MDMNSVWGMWFGMSLRQAGSYQYIKIFVFGSSVCPCVMDVGVAITNLRAVCKIVTCVSAFTDKHCPARIRKVFSRLNDPYF